MAISKIFIVLGAATAAGLLWLAAPQNDEPMPGSTTSGLSPIVRSEEPAHAALQAELAQCKAFADPEDNTLDWDRAIQTCGEVLQLDPINVEARKARKLAEKESVQKKIYDEGHALVTKGEDLAAMKRFTDLETASIYFRPARAEFIRSAPIAANRAAEACLTAYQRKDPEHAWPTCKVYADVSCYLGFHDEDKYKPTFDLLKATHKGTDDWVCPEAYRRFLGGVCDIGSWDGERTAAIKKKYADPDLAAAVIHFSSDYIKGQAALQRYLGKGGKDPASAKKMQALMNTAFDEHQKGYERILKSDLAGAGKHYTAALAADEQVTPKEWPSNQAKAMRFELSDKYAEKAKSAFEHSRFPEAFDACEAGHEFSKSNPDILECLSTLENKATQLAQGPCADKKRVLQMTRPESIVFKNATKLIAESCK